jgi:glycosyltransferase involved in cell wall biosynthesis
MVGIVAGDVVAGGIVSDMDLWAGSGQRDGGNYIGARGASKHLEVPVNSDKCNGAFCPPVPAGVAARTGNKPIVADLISIVVTTYNREDALAAVLRGLSRQTDPDFEVIVADDGSRPDTALLVETWKGQVGRRLNHIWHEDRGFRAAEIRNRAVLLSRGAYCVFLDGDCIPRPGFVAAHRALAEAGCFVAGNRVLLSSALTERVLREQQTPEVWDFGRWLWLRVSGGVNRVMALLTLPLGPLRRLRERRWEGVRSCNFAIWRADLEYVDGFDSAYIGWGKEDSDLVARLLQAGVRRKDGMFATAVLHLHHPEADRNALPENERKLRYALDVGDIRAHVGLSALRAADERQARSS